MTRQSLSAGDASPTTACRQLSRRRLLAAGTTVASAGLAGCTRAMNFIAGLALDDVNLSNETDQPLSGSITITGPNESTVLDESFDIEPDDDEDDEIDDDSGAAYGDVLTEAGEYTVAIELDDDSEVEETTEAETSVAVTDPDEEHIMVVFGAEDLDEPIGVLVIEEFTDLGDHVDD